MKRFTFIQSSLFFAAFLLLSMTSLQAHCQIPCGIYGDQQRIFMLQEDVTTIEKSMTEISRLSAESPVNYNQLVRWIDNKEVHAQKIQDIVNAYFLTQRIKPVATTDKQAYAAYTEKVVVLQQMLVQAMKCKQTTEVKHCQDLRKSIDRFSKLYFSAEDLKHLKVHN